MMRYVVMGVSGSGKTAIGTDFAAAIGARFIDGDDLHPAENIAKMARGEPLTDADRAPWLDLVGHALAGTHRPVVIGCSALKRSYRDRIRAGAGGGPVVFLYLRGARDVIAGRMKTRQGHFMPPALLDSQFAALEPPAPDEHAVEVDIDQPPAAVVTDLVSAVKARQK